MHHHLYHIIIQQRPDIKIVGQPQTPLRALEIISLETMLVYSHLERSKLAYETLLALLLVPQRAYTVTASMLGLLQSDSLLAAPTISPVLSKPRHAREVKVELSKILDDACYSVPRYRSYLGLTDIGSERAPIAQPIARRVEHGSLNFKALPQLSIIHCTY